MTLHNIISNKISLFLEKSYYDNLKKLYNKNLENIFEYSNFNIIKPEYFIYIQYYIFYLFLYYLTYKNVILYSMSLHSTYICELIYNNLELKYNYKSNYNIDFLKNIFYIFFIYLFYLKILLIKIYKYKKIIILSTTSIFYILDIINNVYKERLECIENKKEFHNKLKILVITPNKNIIKNIIKYTNFFNYTNYLFIINILLYFLL
jgi:hypothetical protein